jgi:hypothetical protein
MLTWVKVSKYCELTGDTPQAVYTRRSRGQWIDGLHCKIKARKLWINLPEIQKWLEQDRSQTQAAKRTRSRAA